MLAIASKVYFLCICIFDMLNFAAISTIGARNTVAAWLGAQKVTIFRQISLALSPSKPHHPGVRTNGMGKETDFIRSGTHPA
jgi:hypothetical protein